MGNLEAYIENSWHNILWDILGRSSLISNSWTASMFTFYNSLFCISVTYTYSYKRQQPGVLGLQSKGRVSVNKHNYMTPDKIERPNVGSVYVGDHRSVLLTLAYGSTQMALFILTLFFIF